MVDDTKATTIIGDWTIAEPCSAELEDTVRRTLDAFADDYDIPGLCAALRVAIDEALPDGVSLCGNQFVGPYLGAADSGEAIRAAYASVDFWDIAERFDRG